MVRIFIDTGIVISFRTLSSNYIKIKKGRKIMKYVMIHLYFNH